MLIIVLFFGLGFVVDAPLSSTRFPVGIRQCSEKFCCSCQTVSKLQTKTYHPNKSYFRLVRLHLPERLLLSYVKIVQCAWSINFVFWRFSSAMTANCFSHSTQLQVKLPLFAVCTKCSIMLHFIIVCQAIDFRVGVRSLEWKHRQN